MLGKVRAHVHVEGLVQGVFFRSHTRRLALRLGVCGWVRNLPDGRVEALFEGEEDEVQQIIEWCRKGPIGARVEEVKVQYGQHRGDHSTFEIIY